MNGTPPTDYSPPVAQSTAAVIPDDSYDSNFDQIYDICKAMYDNYVTPYTKIANYQAQLVKDITHLMSTITNSVEVSSDGNNVTINSTPIYNEIAGILSKYTDINNNDPVFVSQGTGEAGRAEALRWAQECHLPESSVVQVINKDDPDNPKFSVNIDLSSILTIRDSILSGTVPTLKFQGMDGAINGEKSTIETNAQLVTTNLGDANSKFENNCKTFTEYLQSVADMVKQFFQSIA